ncbi:MAG: Ribosomal subunit interface protein [Candidatus Moranbacteria bacterium GW2011_GWD2_36_12]|nr:MAG: Ribosomal subunit interface protein [Candidatus Moranbacteria bacterium GW2011_GWD2_36_12]KKQ06496.1 MAG: Ribosomal subunit interface protein [Candidatus Moranbacteria bacterium GW2011_GWE2_36_40]
MSATENMRFFFKGIEIDGKTREYIKKRLETLDKFAENILKSEVEIDLDKKGKFRVEVMLHTPRNMFRADNTTESIEASIDMVTDELQTQVTHLKDKLRTLKKRGAISIKKKIVLDEGARF